MDGTHQPALRVDAPDTPDQPRAQWGQWAGLAAAADVTDQKNSSFLHNPDPRRNAPSLNPFPALSVPRTLTT